MECVCVWGWVGVGMAVVSCVRVRACACVCVCVCLQTYYDAIRCKRPEMPLEVREAQEKLLPAGTTLWGVLEHLDEYWKVGGGARGTRGGCTVWEGGGGRD